MLKQYACTSPCLSYFSAHLSEHNHDSSMPIEPLERSLREMGLRLTELQEQLPEIWDEGDDEDTDDLVASINAIEEEWLVDPDLRRQFSVIEEMPNDDD